MTSPDESVRCFAACRVVTCDPSRATPHDPLGVIENGAIAFLGDTLVRAGSEADLRGEFPFAKWEVAKGNTLTPGLVDAHTHAAWVGSRDNEYAIRMAGGDYEAIAAAGGGIVSSMRSVRAANVAEIAETLQSRLLRMMSLGVTTVEVKSGYGLDEAGELKQLDAIDTVRRANVGPRVVPTFLGLHALPPEMKGDREGYSRKVTAHLLPQVAERGLARFVDAYVDRSAFSVEAARPFFEKARAFGLDVRIHAGQFADVGGVELAAEVGAYSADHLENVGAEGIRRMAGTKMAAVLLPAASFTLRQEAPNVAGFRAAGIPLVVASDSNPGTAPTESLPLALAFAVRMYGLTPAEALLGATREAAISLGLGEVAGVLKEGYSADFVVWDLPHENAIVQPWGVPRVRWVGRAGHLVGPST